ncbi:hypothetical protein RA11412_2201 [Rothia aeria]|uniref:Uncharacterized protein n=1 Tax=Rothia aeria TaxID=172042 RepID=A0A2Z5R1R2_9MICC|nr:hypothetical protein RA11412_2201 [Rothia aeria]
MMGVPVCSVLCGSLKKMSTRGFSRWCSIFLFLNRYVAL